MTHGTHPPKQGLYDPRYEHDACGVGFVVDLKSRKSHAIVEQALQILVNLEHRGACGCEKNTGDGAGILMQMPHDFLAKVCERAGFRCRTGRLRRRLRLPADRRRRPPPRARSSSSEIVREEGQTVLGWRDVPVDPARWARPREGEPVIRQIFIGRGDAARPPRRPRLRAQALRHPPPRRERRPRLRHAAARDVLRPCALVQDADLQGHAHRRPAGAVLPDLADPDLDTALALVHSRFSTNTFPSWARAHPYRYIAHNGEINTLRGNVNWMHARESLFGSELFGADMKKILPIIDQAGSDSAMFDNALELLVLAGRSLPHAVMMMIPEPWSGDASMSAGQEGVLRIPFVPDGAVGRPGVDRLHRRRPHRRRARPQRPAAVALLRHQGRSGHHGLRGRRARHPAGARPVEGPPAAGPHVPGRYRAGPHHRRRGDQAQDRRRNGPTASG